MPRRKWKIKRFLENEELLTEDQDTDSREPEILQKLLPACVSENKWKQTKEIYQITLAAEPKRKKNVFVLKFCNDNSSISPSLWP